MKERRNLAVAVSVVLISAATLLASACKHMEAGGCCGTCKTSGNSESTGFLTSIEDGRLWVLKDGEKKAEKHITLIGAGPKGMTIKAANKSTALEYLAAKPGFDISIEDGRLWVLKDGEAKAEKHITLIGAGPLGTTIKAANKSTALEYLAAKPGFDTSIEDGRLWVLKDGEAKAEKHITLIGAGPAGMTVKAANRSTALEYLATKPGFKAMADENGRIWIFDAAETAEMPEKHVTRVGAGPQNVTLKALSKDLLDAYCAAK